MIPSGVISRGSWLFYFQPWACLTTVILERLLVLSFSVERLITISCPLQLRCNLYAYHRCAKAFTGLDVSRMSYTRAVETRGVHAILCLSVFLSVCYIFNKHKLYKGCRDTGCTCHLVSVFLSVCYIFSKHKLYKGCRDMGYTYHLVVCLSFCLSVTSSINMSYTRGVETQGVQLEGN